MSPLRGFFEPPGDKCQATKKELILEHLKKNKLTLYYSLGLMAFAALYGFAIRWYFRRG